METTIVKTLSKYSETELLETIVRTSYNIVSLDFKKQQLQERASLIAEVLVQKDELQAEVTQAETLGIKTYEVYRAELKAVEDAELKAIEDAKLAEEEVIEK